MWKWLTPTLIGVGAFGTGVVVGRYLLPKCNGRVTVITGPATPFVRPAPEPEPIDEPPPTKKKT